MPHDPLAATDAAENELRERGLLDAHGITGDIGKLLGVFAHADLEADLKYAPAPGREVRVLVALSGRAAARWIIDGDDVTIESVFSSESAFAALVGALPDAPPAPGKPVSLRTEALRQAAAASAEQAGSAAERTAISELRRAGVRSDDARNAVQLLAEGRSLQGQFGVAAYTSRLRKRVRGKRVVEVIGKDDGRVIRYQVGEHTTIAPADPGLTARAISQLADETRATARDA